MKIAVFLPNWVGDACMSTPALRALRAHFPTAEIVGIGRPQIQATLDGCPFLDRFMLWNPRSQRRAERGWRLSQRLREEHFDRSVLLPNSWRAASMAWLARIPQRLGFSRDARKLLLTESLPMRDRSQPHSALNEYLRLVSHWGCDTQSRRMSLGLTAKDNAAAAEFWNGRKDRYICMNTGGAFGAAKDWPTDYFAEVARRWAIERGDWVVVLCGPAERKTAQAIVKKARHPRVTSVADQPLSLGLSKALVAGSRLLLTTDSGPRHFAAAFDVPVVTLFGPTHIGWSETHAANSVHLQRPVACGPCQQRVCPEQHHRCMTELRPDVVYRVAAQLDDYVTARVSHQKVA